MTFNVQILDIYQYGCTILPKKYCRQLFFGLQFITTQYYEYLLYSILASHIVDRIGFNLYDMLKKYSKVQQFENLFKMVIFSICFVEKLNEKQILAIALGDSHAKKIQYTKNHAS